MTAQTCPICDANSIREETYSKQLEHRGSTFTVDGLKSAVCENCGTSFFGENHAEHNKQRISEQRVLAIHGVTRDWISAFRTRLGITQGEAGKIFGGGKIAFSRYESGTVTPSQSLVKLLLIAERVPGVLSALRAISHSESHPALLPPNELLPLWTKQIRAGDAIGEIVMWWSANEDRFYNEYKDAA